MDAHYSSKHGTVSRSPFEMYMGFVDMRNFSRMLPKEATDKIDGIQTTFDTLDITVRGFNIGVKVESRVPYSLVEYSDNGAPFEFKASFHFDACPSDSARTDFHIELSADLNLMMKMMLGPKLQTALDQLVDGLVAASEGRMPDIKA